MRAIMTATSHLTGEKINRFTHIHQSVDDLLNKQKMTRLYCQQERRLHPALHGHRRHERPLGRHL